MPEGPVVGFLVLGAWLMRLLFAFLTVLAAVWAFRASKGHGDVLTKLFGGNADLREVFQYFGKWIVVIMMIVATLRVPPMVFADAASVDSLFKTLWEAGKGVLTGFGGG